MNNYEDFIVLFDARQICAIFQKLYDLKLLYDIIYTKII